MDKLSKTSSAISTLVFINIFLIINIHLAEGQEENDTGGIITQVDKLSWHVWCKMQMNGQNCEEGGVTGRFYYDIALGDCTAGDMGSKCAHNLNAFDSVSECHDACNGYAEHDVPEKIGPQVYCRMQPDFGLCEGYHPRWYFDISERQCKGFSFSGCGGNLNRFMSFQVCSAVCYPLVEY